MATQSAAALVKGSPVRSLQKFLEHDLTPAQRAEAFSSLPPEYAERLGGPILATESVPVQMLNRLTEAAAKVKGEPLEQFARRAGKAAASDAVGGIYRFFVLVLTPTALLGKAAQMWHTIYSCGELKVERQSERGARLRLSDFPSEPAGCARVSGWIERMAELTGVKDVEVKHVSCVAKGNAACEWDMSWS